MVVLIVSVIVFYRADNENLYVHISLSMQLMHTTCMHTYTSTYTVKNNSVQNPLLYKISISKGFRFSLFTKPFTCISYITKGFVETL